MPFLFAYYRMLNVAMDLRHAPWLWVHDLSSPDPRYILPIAIVVTMFFMQRMTPQAGMDPAQQKMMNIMMPAMLGYMSFTLPAGLGLYWAMGQIIGIVQQAAMNRTFARPRDAGDDGEARTKEGKIAISFQPSAVSCTRYFYRFSGSRKRYPNKNLRTEILVLRSWLLLMAES